MCGCGMWVCVSEQPSLELVSDSDGPPTLIWGPLTTFLTSDSIPSLYKENLSLEIKLYFKKIIPVRLALFPIRFWWITVISHTGVRFFWFLKSVSQPGLQRGSFGKL